MKHDEKCGKKHVNCGLVLIMMTNESKNQGGPVSKTGGNGTMFNGQPCLGSLVSNPE